jgi:hypothetical protein
LPSDPAFTTTQTHVSPPVTGRCYCGKTTFSATNYPYITTYCHCSDCRRLSGAPAAAHCAFTPADLNITPAPHHAAAVTKGVERWFCEHCGTALAATYDYLPDQVYVPLGVIDQINEISPQFHCHAESMLPWLEIDDDLPRSSDSGRDVLAPPSPQ